MAITTYIPVGTYTVPSAQANYTLNVPNTYTDLVLIINGSTAAEGSFRFQFNGDSGTNYSSTLLYGTGSQALSLRGTNETSGAGGRGSTGNSTSTIHFMNYSNSSMYKSVISRGNNPTAYSTIQTSLWRSTAPITSILISNEGGNLLTDLTLTLYGII